MQQAIYNSITIQTTKTTGGTTVTRRTSLRRLAQKWDLFGVLALMTSSTAYGIFAIAHTF